jgi:Cu-Zn family superoxide dismutase
MEKGSAMKKLVAVMLVLLAPALVAWAADAGENAGPQKAIAVLHGVGSSHVHGQIVFTQQDGYVEITGEVMGLTPGQHAFHVHEFGDCSAPDASSAGGHFNPEKKPHGGPDDENRHVGDLGNITADESGKATISVKDKLITLHGEHSIIGRAVIVHGDKDDLKSQPSGNAGTRVACGVVGIANSKPPMPK